TNGYKSKVKNFNVDYSRSNKTLDIGSYSYSWDDFSPESGTSHFVQLQLAPTYRENFYYYAFPAESRHVEIADSIAWLTHDLEMARKRGVRNIFINFHALELVKKGTAWQKSALKALFNEYKISAVFVGHTHSPYEERYQEVFGDVPVYTTGALYSGYFDILKVTWDGFQVQSYQVKDNKVVMVEDREPVAKPKAPLICLKPSDNVQRGDIVKSNLIKNSQQVFMLRQVKTSKALDAGSDGDVYTNKAVNNNPYMRWRMEYLSTNAFGQDFYKITHNKYGKVLDGNSAGNVYIKKWNGGYYQQWEVLKYDGSGIIQLRNRATGRILDAASSGTVSGAKTTLSHGNNYQNWNITDTYGNSIPNVRYFKAKSDNSRGRSLPEGNTSNTWWEYISQRDRQVAAPCVDKINDGFSQLTEVPITNDMDLSEKAIINVLQKNDTAVIHSRNGGWAPNINIPAPGAFKGKAILIKHDAYYSSNIKISRSNVTTVTKDQRLAYISNGREWIMQSVD
ncbi:MAG: RICIN domain-containing protein, partial [Pantoea sp.]|nr:RICIN domain-containing protein [Pantoea sp.]